MGMIVYLLNFKHVRSLSTLFFLSIFAVVFSQGTGKSISANFISEKMIIDGDLSEFIWQTAQKSSGFWQNFPNDTSLAKERTEVMVAYDQNNLYIAAICYDSIPHKYVVQSLKRDFRIQ
ncbi:MAG: hypothetical protein IPJ60_00795 [Sphingobacteriaceae bacterium]|nr:hypothetical protein [Sphingobacteriaceae bacterium]